MPPTLCRILTLQQKANSLPEQHKSQPALDYPRSQCQRHLQLAENQTFQDHTILKLPNTTLYKTTSKLHWDTYCNKHRASSANYNNEQQPNAYKTKCSHQLYHANTKWSHYKFHDNQETLLPIPPASTMTTNNQQLITIPSTSMMKNLQTWASLLPRPPKYTAPPNCYPTQSYP